jgi:nucleolar protein 9
LTIDRQNDLKDALDSLRGKELKISTDPDTAITLERLLPSLGVGVGG